MKFIYLKFGIIIAACLYLSYYFYFKDSSNIKMIGSLLLAVAAFVNLLNEIRKFKEKN